MEKETVNSICNQIYRQFPEVSGVKPSVKPQGSNYLFVFHGSANMGGGKKIERTVRVVADASGKINKVTTSR
ncbi:MAG: hypothetical protein HGA28_00375 [Anaerolineaceae bacterium]|nr:hypothetical protein [Anaerolineaceae bacterium]